MLMPNNTVYIKDWGCVDYHKTLLAMQAFVNDRRPETLDEFWIVEHFPVYTQGVAGRASHILNAGKTPIVSSDRGGQVTYHGPGQLVIYLMLDLQRCHLTTRSFVSLLEDAMVNLLADYGLVAKANPKAPGVYVEGAKIGSIGLRVKQNYSYHGLSFNVDMDLSPFNGINPCGYPGMLVTQLSSLGIRASLSEVRHALINKLVHALRYGNVCWAKPGSRIHSDAHPVAKCRH